MAKKRTPPSGTDIDRGPQPDIKPWWEMQPDAPDEARDAALEVVRESLHGIATLPQADVIDPKHAQAWVRRTLAVDPTRIAWHIRRAGGIGGSEVGTLMAWAYGKGVSREGADRLGRRKMMMLPPDAGNHDTLRGIYLEDTVRQLYEERLTRDGRSWKRRDDLKALVEAGPHPQMPWLRASLDGVYEIDGVVTITDYKAPSPDALEQHLKHGHYDEYRAQLNHYAMVAQARGVDVGALDLVFLDYVRIATEGVRICPVAVDPTLQAEIAAAADEFWNNYVMRGIVPPSDRAPVLEADDVPPEIEMAARNAVVAKIMTTHFNEVFENSRGSVTAWTAATGRLRGGMLPLGSMAEGGGGFLQVSGKPSLDTEAAINRLRMLGVPQGDIEGLRKPDAVDPKKAVAAVGVIGDKLAAAAQAVAPDPTEDLESRLRRFVAALPEGGPAAALRDTLQEAADTMLGSRTRQNSASAALVSLAGSLPIKERGGFDEVKVALALVQVGEVAEDFASEKLSANLPRSESADLAILKDRVTKEADGLLQGLVPCMTARQNDEVAPGLGLTP